MILTVLRGVDINVCGSIMLVPSAFTASYCRSTHTGSGCLEEEHKTLELFNRCCLLPNWCDGQKFNISYMWCSGYLSGFKYLHSGQRHVGTPLVCEMRMGRV